jgi:hypothetical protein
LGKNHAGALYEIDKLLILLLDDWTQKYVPLIVMMIPVKRKDFFFRSCKGTLHGYSSRVLASNGLFHRFRACAVCYHAESSSEIASAGIKAAESYP